jgi:hypothetical protein
MTATVPAGAADAPISNFTNCHRGILKRLNALDELPALLEPAARASLPSSRWSFSAKPSSSTTWKKSVSCFQR